jgi:hypothetical protein
LIPIIKVALPMAVTTRWRHQQVFSVSWIFEKPLKTASVVVPPLIFF